MQIFATILRTNQKFSLLTYVRLESRPLTNDCWQSYFLTLYFDIDLQACQGDSDELGVLKKPEDTRNADRIPSWQDFLLIYGTFPGQTSRVFDGGSRFTESFHKILTGPESNRYDLISLLTLVNRDVAEMGASTNKQMSFYQSTLIRFLKLEKAPKVELKRKKFSGDEVDASMSGNSEEGEKKSVTNTVPEISNFLSRLESSEDPHAMANSMFELTDTLRYTPKQIFQVSHVWVYTFLYYIWSLPSHQFGQVIRNHCTKQIDALLTTENVFFFYQLAFEEKTAPAEESLIESFIE